MGTTTIDNLPYPSLSDQPSGPGQMQALAEAIDGRLFHTGMQMEWIGTAEQVPDGWLAADGSAVTVASGNTALRDLLVAAGNPYGVSGSDPLLPDTRGKVVVGKAGSGTFQTLGATGGAETHTLTAAQMPSHSHGPGSMIVPAMPSAYTAPSLMGSGPTSAFGVTGTANAGVAGITDAAGGGAAHNNLQPYVVVNKIIKT